MKHRQRKLKKQRRRQNSRPLSKLENMCIVLDLTRVFVPFEEARQFLYVHFALKTVGNGENTVDLEKSLILYHHILTRHTKKNGKV